MFNGVMVSDSLITARIDRQVPSQVVLVIAADRLVIFSNLRLVQLDFDCFVLRGWARLRDLNFNLF
jgi:hypothetical protein